MVARAFLPSQRQAAEKSRPLGLIFIRALLFQAVATVCPSCLHALATKLPPTRGKSTTCCWKFVYETVHILLARVRVKGAWALKRWGKKYAGYKWAR
jgi:hypothetical protein